MTTTAREGVKMATYRYAKLEPVETPTDWNKPGWHHDPFVHVEVYRNADTGETVAYVVDHA